MLHHLLVCLKPTPGNRACRAAALELGVRTGAVLSGVFVRAPDHRPEQAELADAAFDPFTHDAREAGVRAGIILREGDVQAELVAAAQATDLVLMGHDWRRSESLLESIGGELARSVERPVMVVTEWRAPVATIAVAYDGSPAADRALAAAADLTARWSKPAPELVLIAVNDATHEDLRFLEPARRYLNAYDLAYRVSTAPGAPDTLITALGLMADASLLCMGAFGHNLLREFLLGSTTQSVLASWPRALLLTR